MVRVGRIQKVGVTVQKKEEMVHISRWKNQGHEGPGIRGVPRSNEKVIRWSKHNGHDTKVLPTTSQGKPSFEDGDPEMA